MIYRTIFLGLAAISLAACEAGSASLSENYSDEATSLKGRYSLSNNCSKISEFLSIGEDTIQFSETVCKISSQVEDGDVWRLDLVNCVSDLGKVPDQRFEFFLDGKSGLSVFSEDGESHYTRCSN